MLQDASNSVKVYLYVYPMSCQKLLDEKETFVLFGQQKNVSLLIVFWCQMSAPQETVKKSDDECQQ